MDRTAAEHHVEFQGWVEKENEERATRGVCPISLPGDSQEQESAQVQTVLPVDVPDPTKENLELLVARVESAGWENFGFWAFRVDYSDEALWERFDVEFFKLLNEGIQAAPVESGMSRIDDNVFIRYVSDEDLANQGPEGISYAYQLSLEDDPPDEDDDESAEGWPKTPEPGMTTSMCLMLDEESMRSVVDRKPGSTPFVKAVNATLCQPKGKTLPYPGSFKVAVTSLITKFYPALMLYDPADVAATARDGLWTDIGPFDSDRESRKAARLSAAT